MSSGTHNFMETPSVTIDSVNVIAGQSKFDSR